MNDIAEGTIERRTEAGACVQIGDIAITPQSEAVVARWRNLGGVWNRPVAVVVEQGGRRQRIPIVDVTRLIQFGLIGLSIAFAMVTAALSCSAIIHCRRYNTPTRI